ncbi:MAG: MATE family efflux transporter [Sphaerochaetaceae bacterium]|nr:MATE family efflux transporter [Sphaerochaetaceae bacterium]
MNEIKQNKMQTMPIPALIISMSLPMMLSMLIQALYNIVDSIFISRVSEAALTAVSLAFPLQNIVIALSVGTSVGINSLLSRRLGEQKEEEATHVAETGLFLSFITYIAVAILGLTLSRTYVKMFTNDKELISLTLTYLHIVMGISFGIFISVSCEKILQGTGDTFHPMLMQLMGAITNIILDPIFIFTFKLGIAGAAYATVIGQILSMVMSIYFVRKNKYIHVRIRSIRPRKKIVGEIYQVALPTIIMNSIGTIMTSALNAILIGFSSTAVSVFGVYFKLQSFIFMPLFGMNSALTPILGFNYGARNRKRMVEAIKWGLLIAVTIMSIGTLIFNLVPDKLLSLFNASEEMLSYGVPALKIISLHFVSAAFSIILISTFQAMGLGYISMIVSILRQIVVLVPSAFILSRIFGINGVWASFIVGEAVALIFCVTMFARVYNKKIKLL